MITSLRGMYQRKTLEDMFLDLEHDLGSINEMGKVQFAEVILTINVHRKMILEALAGDFGEEYDETTKKFKKIEYMKYPTGMGYHSSND